MTIARRLSADDLAWIEQQISDAEADIREHTEQAIAQMRLDLWAHAHELLARRTGTSS